MAQEQRLSKEMFRSVVGKLSSLPTSAFTYVFIPGEGLMPSGDRCGSYSYRYYDAGRDQLFSIDERLRKSVGQSMSGYSETDYYEEYTLRVYSGKTAIDEYLLFEDVEVEWDDPAKEELEGCVYRLYHSIHKKRQKPIEEEKKEMERKRREEEKKAKERSLNNLKKFIDS